MTIRKMTVSELKESVLALLALFWGIVFLLPGETLNRASPWSYLSSYANDTVWGVLLITGAIFILFSSKIKFFGLKKWVHLFFWLFWIGIFLLMVIRLSFNGLTSTDILLCSFPSVIALLHGLFYIKLVHSP